MAAEDNLGHKELLLLGVSKGRLRSSACQSNVGDALELNSSFGRPPGYAMSGKRLSGEMIHQNGKARKHANPTDGKARGPISWRCLGLTGAT